MKKAAPWLVSLLLTGSRPERVLNLYARQGLRFYAPERLDELRLRVWLRRKDLERAGRLAESVYCEAEPGPEARKPGPVGQIKRRILLLPLAAVCALGIMLLSLFIWDIRVSGNETLTDAEILQALESEGVYVGSFGLGIDRELLRSRMMEALPKLAWMTVNVSGCRAEVIVRERIEPPPMLDPEAASDIVAAKTGLITELRVFSGVPVAEKGDTVLEGETLITGRRDSLSGRQRLLPSLGLIRARTWYELSGSVPLSYWGKVYTGRTERKTALLIGGIRVNFYQNGSAPLDYCDKINYKEEVSLPGGMLLPLARITAEYREYEPVLCTLLPEEAEAVLQERLLEQLRERIDGEPLSLEFSGRAEGDLYVMTLRAECLEEIGRTIPLGEEKSTDTMG